MYIHICIYTYTIYIYIYFQVLRFLCKPSLTMLCPSSNYEGIFFPKRATSGKFEYMADHFILLRLNPFDLRVDREGWWFEYSCVIVAGLLVSRGC